MLPKIKKNSECKNKKNLQKGAISFYEPIPVFKNMLFASFPTSLKVTSWSTFPSMSCEVTLKIVKKFIKNQSF